ncbi:MAG: type II toxin-antitoxin system HigB family toxin [Deltaproteobacteria bacterium]|nr:type II toxin-antitoxin system HigB family toxin [Deltaproteobacteria bacterium]
MRVIARARLRTFWEAHADAEEPLRRWFGEAERADWTSPSDVRSQFATASFGSDRVVFNIGGNKYRLVVMISYARHTVFIRFIGTHAAYDGVNVEEV